MRQIVGSYHLSTMKMSLKTGRAPRAPGVGAIVPADAWRPARLHPERDMTSLLPTGWFISSCTPMT